MLKIGKVLEGPGPKDAIHVAVVPVLLAEDMHPGDWVRVVGGKAYKADEKAIGVIDPFLDEYLLFEDTWVYMLLIPNTITNLSHEWTLEEFDSNSAFEEIPRLDEDSVDWLEDFAHMHNTSYDALVVKCLEALASDNEFPYITFYGRDIHEIPDGFWDHFRKATGLTVLESAAEKVDFTCSC